MTTAPMPNRHQRRQEQRQRQRAICALRDAQHEGQGVWDLRILFPEDALRLMAEAVANQHAAVLFGMLVDAIRDMEGATERAMCLLCPRTFGLARPRAFVLLTPLVGSPRNGIANALCDACAQPTGPLLDRVMDSYRQAGMGNLRVLPAPHPAGRA
jgi:hypothetical protein